jgi:glycerophosphoryl diester phosphodiesterase
MQKNLFILFLVLLTITSFSADKKKLELVVHRGANKLAPENTMAAAQKCIELGADYVEIDVRTSKDGVLYILHDFSLDRTTNGTGPIQEMHSDEIDKLDVGSWYSEEFAGERVPRLETYLNAVKGKVKIYFDVKKADLNQLIEMVYKTGFQDDCFFWFSNNRRAAEFRKLDNKLALKMSVKKIEDLDFILDFNPQLIECSLELLNPQIIHFCKTNQLKIMVNALQKEGYKNYQKIIDSEADMVNLDYPDKMIDLIK